jgi:hypothetical protein
VCWNTSYHLTRRPTKKVHKPTLCSSASLTHSPKKASWLAEFLLLIRAFLNDHFDVDHSKSLQPDEEDWYTNKGTYRSLMIYDVPATTKSNHISDSMYHLDSLSSLKHSKSALSFLNAMCQMVRTVYAQLVWSSRCQLDQFNDVSVLQQLDGFSCFIFSGAFVELVVGIQTLPGNNRTSNTVKGITRNNISHLRRQFLLDII